MFGRCLCNIYAEQAQAYSNYLLPVLHVRMWLARHALEARTSEAREQHAAAEPIKRALGAPRRDLDSDYFKPLFGKGIPAFADIF